MKEIAKRYHLVLNGFGVDFVAKAKVIHDLADRFDVFTAIKIDRGKACFDARSNYKGRGRNGVTSVY